MMPYCRQFARLRRAVGGRNRGPLGDVTPETDATSALDSAAPDARTFASRKQESSSLLADARMDFAILLTP